jgi:hypothetical protein
MWEEGIVTSVMKVAMEYPDATFLDLGSNLGVYSMMVAALRRSQGGDGPGRSVRRHVG